MKILLLNLLCFIFPAFLFAQDLTGLWTGTLINDSTKKEQHYELALTEYRGKVHGYSYTTFIRNDTFYYSIKTLKATKQDSVWIVEDDDMVANNFPVKPDKGVHQINTFYLNKADSTWNLDGTWHTNKTKRFYSISGTMAMKQEDNLDKSWLIPHLEEMDLAKNIPFYVAKQKASNDDTRKEVAVQKKPQEPIKKQNSTEPEKKPAIPVDNTITKKENNKPEPTVNPEPPKQKTAEDVTVSNNKKPETQPVKENSVAINNKPVISKNQSSSKPNEEPVAKNDVVKQDKPSVKQQAVTQTTVSQNKPAPKETATVETKDVPVKQSPATEPKKTEPVSTTVIAAKPVEQKKEEVKPVPVSIPYTTRKVETTETVFYSSDSLVLSLYDNGVVDGDSVSVLFNGEVILAHQRMSEKAINKTIYITPDIPDSVQLILFADNLGTIPPNTGLLVVRDGDKRYQVHFSADLSKNAAIIFKRKK
ncbi:MAG: hypothetical protein JSU05_00680 [Bacteroidetes bacterium]|nr:hypothetical protein [Bacteroidota bacterium]